MNEQHIFIVSRHMLHKKTNNNKSKLKLPRRLFDLEQ